MSPAALPVFVVAFVPVLVLAAIWAAVMAWRLFHPERPLPLLPDRAAERRATLAGGQSVPVGFREIHDDVRARARSLALPYRYPVADGLPHHLPEPWLDDLQRRRN